MLTLYTNIFSSNAQKVHFFLEHAKIPYQPHVIDLPKGEQRSDSYLKMNLFGTVPAIDHDGFKLAESNAILRYLAHRFENFDAYPNDLKERAKVDQMLDFATIHVSRWIQAVFWYQVLAPMLKMPVVQASIDDAKDQLSRSLPKLERWSKTSGYFLCGAKLSIADVSLAPMLAQARFLKLPIDEFPSVKSYADRVLSLPAWIKTEEEIKKFFRPS